MSITRAWREECSRLW